MSLDKTFLRLLALQVVKFVAVPATAVLGIASFRVHYAIREANVEGLLTPHQVTSTNSLVLQ